MLILRMGERDTLTCPDALCRSSLPPSLRKRIFLSARLFSMAVVMFLGGAVGCKLGDVVRSGRSHFVVRSRGIYLGHVAHPQNETLVRIVLMQEIGRE